MTKKEADSIGWKIFFTDASGCIRYNKKCMGCSRKCKQSFRAKVVCCPVYDRVDDINKEK